jgi:hypothetical protein
LVHTVDILVGIQSGSPERYDIGYFVGQDGNDPTASRWPVFGGDLSDDRAPTAPPRSAGLTATTTSAATTTATRHDQLGDKRQGDLHQGVPHRSGVWSLPYAIVYANNTNGTCTSVDDVTAGIEFEVSRLDRAGGQCLRDERRQPGVAIPTWHRMASRSMARPSRRQSRSPTTMLCTSSPPTV